MHYTASNSPIRCDLSLIRRNKKKRDKIVEIPLCNIFSCKSMLSRMWLSKKRNIGKHREKLSQGRNYEFGDWKKRKNYAKEWEKPNREARQSERRTRDGSKRETKDSIRMSIGGELGRRKTDSSSSYRKSKSNQTKRRHSYAIDGIDSTASVWSRRTTHGSQHSTKSPRNSELKKKQMSIKIDSGYSESRRSTESRQKSSRNSITSHDSTRKSLPEKLKLESRRHIENRQSKHLNTDNNYSQRSTANTDYMPRKLSDYNKSGERATTIDRKSLTEQSNRESRRNIESRQSKHLNTNNNYSQRSTANTDYMPRKLSDYNKSGERPTAIDRKSLTEQSNRESRRNIENRQSKHLSNNNDYSQRSTANTNYMPRKLSDYNEYSERPTAIENFERLRKVSHNMRKSRAINSPDENERARILQWRKRNSEGFQLQRRGSVASELSSDSEAERIAASLKTTFRMPTKVYTYEKKPKASKDVQSASTEHPRISEVRAAIFKMLKSITNPPQSNDRTITGHYKGVPMPTPKRKSVSIHKRQTVNLNRDDKTMEDTTIKASTRESQRNTDSNINVVKKKESAVLFDLSKSLKQLEQQQIKQKRLTDSELDNLILNTKESSKGTISPRKSINRSTSRGRALLKKLDDPIARAEYLKKLKLMATKPLFERRFSHYGKMPKMKSLQKIVEKKPSEESTTKGLVKSKHTSNISMELEKFRKSFLQQPKVKKNSEKNDTRRAHFPILRNRMLRPLRSYNMLSPRHSQDDLDPSSAAITSPLENLDLDELEDRMNFDNFGQPLAVRRTMRSDAMAIFDKNFREKMPYVPPISYMEILELSPDEFNTLFRGLKKELNDQDFRQTYAALKANSALTLKFRQEQLRNYFNDEDAKVSDMDDISIDDIDLSAFLHFPYPKKYHDPQRIKETPKPKSKLSKPKTKKLPKKVDEKQLKKEASDKPNCCICDFINGTENVKDEPFIIKMKDQIKRDELKAYLRNKQILQTGPDKINTHFTPEKPSILVKCAEGSTKYQSSPTHVFFRN